ncbi:protein-disulfide reductase DsbD [Acinetobacter haemolyticus]|uniref:Protein-disulfide reductase DsbD n=1 Tax=Acinetobacter haemolyticus TaxID=29430 RepID=A0A4P7B3S9_ACIHA|nr:protein-disulfide reductase DsbD [Acinetobacter haemolyticus]QBQ15861.1 protein-disulfide reductase DsbD [Acinetobacter haemolyticus]
MLMKPLIAIALCIVTTSLYANQDFLPPDQAFKFQASSISEKTAELKWDIAPHYYLYHDQFKVRLNQQNLSLNLPKGQEKDDPTFGVTHVHYNQVLTQIGVKPNSQYTVSWQGCSEDGLCYPVQRTTITTDAAGLLPQQNSETNFSNFAALVTQENISEVTPESEAQAAHEKSNPEISSTLQKIKSSKPLNNQVQEQVEIQPQKASLSDDWNNDQFFLNLLSNQGVFFNIILFLGLGILLAFLPCSLPLIPILSGILVQGNKGYKAAIIALTFVMSMALVYGLMGIVVSQIGYGIQRWFQNPVFIGLFALMFIVFALNLFGLYQLSLPQGFLQRLDQIQQRQKGGTLLGAGIMGVVSALIVGPCMSAPLAGALLYVSQLEYSLLGGFYLFLLGLGMGIPLFIASVFGAKYLPKPGLWMDRLKLSFGFIMLAMAVYFARPLLPLTLYYAGLALILIAMAGYLIAILRHIVHIPYKVVILVLICGCTVSGIWYINQATTNVKTTESDSLQSWIIVKNQHELNQVLAAYAKDPIVVDVYADWCVACQPIEREILPRTDVQDALKNVIRIKLDLTQYEASQDIILKQWQILGPPTILFLSPNQKEQRDLRLTGTYTASQLIQNIQKLNEENQP